ncbi:MAG: low molecular weight protein arginine phosphatase [Candidatus Aureabacteria bacterium]|nr:low molecular weight protein arginine phosphatase [Candidatus Auribacterota bacterium]
MKTILFVCTGNTCRSPMAQCYFDHLTRGKNIRTFSAGTASLNGFPASSLASRIMARYQLDLSSHKTRKVEKELLDQSDMIIVMTEFHRDYLLREWPETGNKIFLLREFDKNPLQGRMDIDDPMGGSEDFYQQVFDLMKEPLERLSEMV